MIVVELGIEFEPRRDVPPGDEPEDALLGAMARVVAGLEIKIERAHALRHLERQQQARSGRCEAPALTRQRACGLELRKHRQLPAVLALIEESPFHSRVSVAPAADRGLTLAGLQQVGDLIGELDSLAQAEVKIDLRKLVGGDAALQR